MAAGLFAKAGQQRLQIDHQPLSDVGINPTFNPAVVEVYRGGRKDFERVGHARRTFGGNGSISAATADAAIIKADKR